MAFKISKEAALSAGILIGTGVLALLKGKDTELKEAKKKEEWISEAIARLSEKKED